MESRSEAYISLYPILLLSVDSWGPVLAAELLLLDDELDAPELLLLGLRLAHSCLTGDCWWLRTCKFP